MMFSVGLAACAVALLMALVRAMRGPTAPKPVVFTTPATQSSAGGLVTYANSITLTPGTVTIEIDGDGTSGHSFLVHALDPSFMADVDSGDMNRRVTALEGGSAG